MSEETSLSHRIQIVISLVATGTIWAQLFVINSYRAAQEEACNSACERRGSLTERFSSGEIDHQALMCYCPDGTELHMDIGAMWVENDE